MAHTVLWPRVQFFYPVGNTSAVCLGQDLPPQEPARCLLLGCGDPRNILFTLHTLDEVNNDAARAWDFTCCDKEPAIIARNILLFTLIVDGFQVEKIFDIFFHFKVDGPTYSMILEQCRKLIRLSSTLKSWKECVYGDLIRICTLDAFLAMRPLWILWAETEHQTASEQKPLEDKFRAASSYALAKAGADLPVYRSTSPFSLESATISPKHFTDYWKNGCTSSSNNFPSETLRINPTFAFATGGEEELSLHYGTDPLRCFHSAAAFAPLKAGSPLSTNHSTKNVVQAAHAEFLAWCRTFKALFDRSPKQISIRVFVGDALSFCRALHYRSQVGGISSDAYQGTWGVQKLTLDGSDYDQNAATPAPLSFNVIDTSNISDHVGLLNVLISAAPLLSRSPTTSLFTEVFLSAIADPSAEVEERLGADIPMISLWFGISPISFVSNFTSFPDVDRPRHRITWKAPHFGDAWTYTEGITNDHHFIFQPEQLARWLFKTYLGVFAEDDLRPGFSPIAATLFYEGQDLLHYTQSTFAAFMKMVKDKTSTDWDQTMKYFLALFAVDRSLLICSTNHQDLLCQLHIRGVHTFRSLKPSWQGVPTGRFRKWDTVPVVVCVVLTIPRSRVKALERLSRAEIRTPIMHCETIGAAGHAIFSDLRFTFGSVTFSGPIGQQVGTITEDRAEWSGDSNLVMSFWMPSWMLMVDPETTIRLAIRRTPAALRLVPVLGFGLNIFSTKLSDELHVSVLQTRPDFHDELDKAGSSYNYGVPEEPNPAIHSVAVNLDNACDKISTFMIRTDLTEDRAKGSLAKGIAVVAEQISPATMRLTFPGFEKIVIFPFPIDGTSNKIRIARKSAYIEILVPPASPGSEGGYTSNLFPVIPTPYGPVAWNIHRLNLDVLPALDTSFAPPKQMASPLSELDAFRF